jgi:anti-sigma regulatory factor (Ser/Thr protein kinase)
VALPPNNGHSVRRRGAEIRAFILARVAAGTDDLTAETAEQFQISRQAVHKHIRKLLSENALTETGKTRARTYELVPESKWSATFQIQPELAEDVVWERNIVPVLGDLPKNVMDIWRYCFTEMFNNAIEHSAGTSILVSTTRDSANTTIRIVDDGIGLFRKIQSELGLLDERHALLELSKGKLTTDPKRHTGEGIFFSSKMVDQFIISAGKVFFTHKAGAPHDWILDQEEVAGTTVVMKLSNHSARTLYQVFHEFSANKANYGFTKTVIPIELAQAGADSLVSRSQAKRILARVDRFETVVLDFKGVASIGQAFADEIFRVYTTSHPEINIYPINANHEVQSRILAAVTNRI